MLSCRLQPSRILLETPDVNIGTLGNSLNRRVIERAHGTRGRADDQRPFGKALAFGDQRAGTNQAIIADPRAIEQDRAHADQTVGADRAAVEDDVMADHAIRPDRQRKTGIGMQGGVVLDLRALAEFDPLIIAAQYRTEPDTGVPFEPHLTDQGRSRRDPILAGLREFRTHCVEFVDHRFSAFAPSSDSPSKDRKLPRVRQACSRAKPLQQTAGPATTWRGSMTIHVSGREFRQWFCASGLASSPLLSLLSPRRCKRGRSIS